MEGIPGMMEEGLPKLRADYGFYAADNQSSFKGDNYLMVKDTVPTLPNHDHDENLMKARSSNSIQRSGK
jgi:hypothetical protein